MENHMDTEYLDAAKREIAEWESRGPGVLTRFGDMVMWPAQNMAKKIIPSRVQKSVTETIHRVLSGLNNVTHLINNEGEIRRKVEIQIADCGDDLKAGDVVAKEYWNWNLLYGASEGGAAGAIGLFGLAADVPALLAVSLRVIQQIGICYGYDMKLRREQEYVMHVLQVSSTSSLKAKVEVLASLKQLEQILLKVSWRQMGEALARKEISRLSLLAAMRQFAQRLGVQLTRRKALQIVPLLGAVVGASFNGLFVNDTGRAAYMIYRRRRIAELEGSDTKALPLYN